MVGLTAFVALGLDFGWLSGGFEFGLWITFCGDFWWFGLTALLVDCGVGLFAYWFGDLVVG